MADLQPVERDLFERFAMFIGPRRFRTLCALAWRLSARGRRIEPRLGWVTWGNQIEE